MEVFEPSPTGHGGHQEALGMPSIDTIGPTSSASKWSPAPFLFLKKKTATASLKCHHTRKNEDSVQWGSFRRQGAWEESAVKHSKSNWHPNLLNRMRNKTTQRLIIDDFLPGATRTPAIVRRK